MNKQVYRNLKVGYGVSFLILLLVGFVSHRTMNALFESDRMVNHSNLIIQKLEKALSLMKDAETGQRGYLLSGQKQFLEPFEGATQRALKLVNETYQLTAEHPRQQFNISTIRNVMQQRMDILQSLITKKQAGQTINSDDLDAGKAAMDALRKSIERAENYEQQLLAGRVNTLNRYRVIAPMFIFIALALGILVAGISYFRAVAGFKLQGKLYEELNNEKEETAALNEELTAANEEITAANEELTSINEELNEAREGLAEANTSLERRVEERTKALKDSEEELMAINEEMTATNEQLAAANNELLLAEERSGKLAAIVESSDDAIIGKTLDGIITSWNKGAEHIFGYPEQEMVGESILKLIPEDLQYEEPLILARLRNGERIDHYETIRRTQEGKLINVSLTISPIRNKAGQVTGVSKIARDITEQKLDEQRKNDFIGMASHELKTPLTSLTALLQVLQQKFRNSDDEFVSNALARANQQTKRMASLINGFLTVSRLEAGKLNIETHPVYLNAIISESIEEQKLSATGYTFIFEPEGSIVVPADRDKILSVVSNLLSNAVKYSPKRKLVTIKTAIQNNEALISVSDQGMGVKSQDLDKLFSRYYRVQSEHTKLISGFGVGLYLCSEIVKGHGGRIWAESEKGTGSTFYFTLPLEV